MCCTPIDGKVITDRAAVDSVNVGSNNALISAKDSPAVFQLGKASPHGSFRQAGIQRQACNRGESGLSVLVSIVSETQQDVAASCLCYFLL
jgi:hypothetical protein